MTKMKKFTACLEIATITKDGRVLSVNEMPVTVLAEDRNGALLAGLDVGQAVARSSNCSDGSVGIFFRMVRVIEKETL